MFVQFAFFKVLAGFFKPASLFSDALLDSSSSDMASSGGPLRQQYHVVLACGLLWESGFRFWPACSASGDQTADAAIVQMWMLQEGKRLHSDGNCTWERFARRGLYIKYETLARSDLIFHGVLKDEVVAITSGSED